MKHLIRSLLALSLLVASQAAAKAEEILLQSVQSGMYVTVVNGTLAAAAPGPRGASRFDTVRLEGDRVAFRDLRSGSYVRAGVGEGAFLAAGSPHIRGWETFELVRIRGDKLALRSVGNGNYVRAGVGRDSLLAASSGRAAGWEQFRFVNPRDAQAANNNAGNQPGAGQGGNRGGPDLDDLFGNYRITHIAAGNGFLVRLGRELGNRSTLSIDDRGTVRASVGCNSISMRVSVRDGRVRAEGPAISTKMLCQGQGQAAAEAAIIDALSSARRVDRDGRTVTFRDASGADLLKLRRG
ncbi:hypothetical protein LL06_25300 [Hoeflea sp. BAL378]|uniref:META domain-containing protein n=1 Tax=Hoeflea sp. BAL378 TaxID=1547437 RepID=UPI0005132676|nr:META domain-containing protein [Hoeflea sp. BAL378]KGF66931.1 hypothetical protein LL06_25300 [Hoeflea sp. BAL378]